MINKIEFYADVLNIIKKEHNKRNVLYDHGVDLINYENAYTEILIKTILYELPFMNDDALCWWLYEDVDKVIYESVDSDVEHNVESSIDFLMFYYKGE